jgi:hypothetical protein
MELSVSFAPSLDMPLWVRNNKTTNKSPFRNCTAEQLIEISVENLRFFNDNRGRHRDLKLMSVLQGNSIEEEQAWFEAVQPYPFEPKFGSKLRFRAGCVGAGLDISMG